MGSDSGLPAGLPSSSLFRRAVINLVFNCKHLGAHPNYFSISVQLQTTCFNYLFSIFASIPASVSNRDSTCLRPMVAFWQHSLFHSILAQSRLQRSRKCHPSHGMFGMLLNIIDAAYFVDNRAVTAKCTFGTKNWLLVPCSIQRLGNFRFLSRHGWQRSWKRLKK